LNSDPKNLIRNLEELYTHLIQDKARPKKEYDIIVDLVRRIDYRFI